MIVCLFFLLFFIFPLYGRGGMENPLARVDALIEGNRFDEALEALARYSRENPGDLDRAGQRLRRLAEIQGRYNSLVNQLLDTIAEDPGNGEKILALAGELETLEVPRDLRTGELLERIRELVKFAVQRQRLEEIFSRGRELSRAGDFSGALGLYLGELESRREEFFTARQGETEEDPVRVPLLRLSVLAGELESSLAVLDRAAVEMGAAPPEALGEIFGRIGPELDNLERIGREIGDTGAFFDKQLLREEDPALGEGNFFSFASRLIHGQGRGQDGMIRILENCREERGRVLEVLLLSGAEEAYDRALSKARGRRYREAIENYRGAALRNALVRDFLGPVEDGASMAAPLPAGLLVLFCREFAISHSIRAADLELRLELLLAEAGEDPLAGDAAEEFKAALREFSAGAETLEAELRAGREAFLLRLESAPPGGAAGFLSLSPAAGAEEIGRYTAGALEFLENFRSRCLVLELDGSLHPYLTLNSRLGERLERREAGLALANRLMEGLEGEDAAEALREAAALKGAASPVFPESPAGTLRYYSREALGIFQNLRTAAEEDLAYMGDFFSRPGERETPSFPELEALRAAAGKMAKDLETVLARSTEGAARAEERLGQAEDFRAQGDRLYQAARDAAGRGDFAGARLSIQRAADRYSQALSFQEFPSLREEWDTRMLSLGEEIGWGENELIVRDTRDALNQVRSEYLAGNFQSAENLLVRGQNRWMQTNADVNPEISYWLSMVRDAISLRSGREIPATAPLYAEMGQFLSEARRRYGEGAALIRAGRRDEGLACFNEARRGIREVKFIFPGNQEAGLLELRMDQMADPEVFNASFQRRLDEALGGIRRRSAEAFGDLQNLAEINPSYPGIAEAMEQAEIDMGYRPAPPDPQKLQRSAGLTGAARAIVEANDREHFGAALRQLNEALALDPDNAQAMILKDLVLTRMGAGNAVLSSADEGEYQRAVRELQRGNTLIALSVVEQLLQNPRNRNSTRILELRRRVQSFL
jgi:hypothetical protein